MISSAKTFAASKPAVVAPKRAVQAVVPHAQADRRAVLGSLLGGAAALVARPALAGVTNVDLFDDRKAKEKGLDIIYEARDLDLPQSKRDGIDQYRGDVAATKSRLAESTRRINEDLGSLLDKAYWTDAREELRRQLGTMRFDINTLASTKGSKEAKKAALAQGKSFVEDVEKLDYAIRVKDAEKVKKAYATLKTSLAGLKSALA